MSTPKIVDYTVVMEEQSLDSLITKVRNLIGEGWQPLGPMQANRHHFPKVLPDYGPA